MKKLYKNANIYNSKKQKFELGSLLVEDGIIGAVLPTTCAGIIGLTNIEDMSGARIIPGMIDLHTHGRGGYESTEVDGEDMIKLAESYAKAGTTSFLPTLMSVPFNELERAVDSAIYAQGKGGAHMLGIHLEGRYISLEKKGAHFPDYIAPYDPDELQGLIERAKPMKRFLTICAPEMPRAKELIERAISLGAVVSIGHSNADSDTCFEAMEWGATSFTHLYNAMSSLGHRSPGCVGAAFASDCYCELICDGVHVKPTAVKAAYRAKGNKKIALITDSCPSAGLPEGNYRMGGADVILRDGAVFLPDGTLTGGSISLFEAMLNLTKFADISLEEAIPCATSTPAKLIGAYDEVGSLDGGKRADFLVLTDDNKLGRIVLGGEELV